MDNGRAWKKNCQRCQILRESVRWRVRSKTWWPKSWSTRALKQCDGVFRPPIMGRTTNKVRSFIDDILQLFPSGSSLSGRKYRMEPMGFESASCMETKE